jgi:hypothetical protein
MIEQIARFPRVRDRRVFVGDPTTSCRRLRPGLPRIRDWTREHFDFAGYVLPSIPRVRDRAALRDRLGFRRRRARGLRRRRRHRRRRPPAARVMAAAPVLRRRSRRCG